LRDFLYLFVAYHSKKVFARWSDAARAAMDALVATGRKEKEREKIYRPHGDDDASSSYISSSDEAEQGS